MGERWGGRWVAPSLLTPPIIDAKDQCLSFCDIPFTSCSMIDFPIFPHRPQRVSLWGHCCGSDLRHTKWVRECCVYRGSHRVWMCKYNLSSPSPCLSFSLLEIVQALMFPLLLLSLSVARVIFLMHLQLWWVHHESVALPQRLHKCTQHLSLLHHQWPGMRAEKVEKRRKKKIEKNNAWKGIRKKWRGEDRRKRVIVSWLIGPIGLRSNERWRFGKVRERHRLLCYAQPRWSLAQSVPRRDSHWLGGCSRQYHSFFLRGTPPLSLLVLLASSSIFSFPLFIIIYEPFLTIMIGELSGSAVEQHERSSVEQEIWMASVCVPPFPTLFLFLLFFFSSFC